MFKCYFFFNNTSNVLKLTQKSRDGARSKNLGGRGKQKSGGHNHFSLIEKGVTDLPKYLGPGGICPPALLALPLHI